MGFIQKKPAEEPKSALGGVWIAVKAAVLATLCCSTPLLLVPLFLILGFGSVTAALRIPEYKLYFIGLSVVFMLISLYLNIRARNCGVCNLKTVYREKWFVATVLIVYSVLVIAIIYFLLPVLSEFIYSTI